MIFVLLEIENRQTISVYLSVIAMDVKKTEPKREQAWSDLCQLVQKSKQAQVEPGKRPGDSPPSPQEVEEIEVII